MQNDMTAQEKNDIEIQMADPELDARMNAACVKELTLEEKNEIEMQMVNGMIMGKKENCL